MTVIHFKSSEYCKTRNPHPKTSNDQDQVTCKKCLKKMKKELMEIAQNNSHNALRNVRLQPNPVHVVQNHTRIQPKLKSDPLHVRLIKLAFSPLFGAVSLALKPIQWLKNAGK